MAKDVYVFDSTNRLHKYVSTVQVDDNAILESNQTTVAVGNGRFFNGQEWVNEIVNVYHYNGDGYFDYYSVTPQGAALGTNETLVAPLNSDGSGMYKPKFDATQNAWVETLSKEEIEALNKPADPKPNNNDQTISMLTAQLLQTQMTVKQQGTQIASLTGALLANAKAKATN